MLGAKKCMLTGALYSWLLRDSARAWHIQRLMLAANHRTGHKVPNRGARERTKGAEGVCNPIGETIIWTNQYLLGLNHQPNVHMEGPIAPVAYVAEDGLVVINGRRGPWSCDSSMPQCRRMPEPGNRSGWVGEDGRGIYRCFLEGKPEKDNTWNLNKENI